MSDRTHCCIPFCNRTTAKICKEWICGKHWPATSKRLRKVYYKRARRYDKGDISQANKLNRIWGKLKSQALEGALF